MYVNMEYKILWIVEEYKNKKISIFQCNKNFYFEII